MIRRGDLLRVPYTGRLSWDFGFLSVVRLSVAFVLSSTLYPFLDMYIFIYQFYVLFSSVGALLYDSVKLLSG